MTGDSIDPNIYPCHTPRGEQKVEIFVNEVWVKATFMDCGYYPPTNDEGDEIWWMDYFVLESWATIPEDTQYLRTLNTLVV